MGVLILNVDGVVLSDSQFGDIAGEASGQRLQVFVAAADHCVHAGTLAGTLRPWSAAAVLHDRTWAHRREGGGLSFYKTLM